MRFSSVGAALLGLSSSAYAQSGYVSATQSGITYAFSVPDATASSGSGDVYIKMSGPTSFSWIGIGSGEQMSGSKMFIIYANSAGTNVTLSPRSSSGHSQPSYDSSIQATLVDGTSLSNGVMTAVIKCTNCASQFQVTSSQAPLIYGAKSGTLKSDSTSASISQHDSVYGTMSLDMTQAKNSNNANPFGSGSTAATPTTGSTQSCVPISQASGSSASSGSGTAASAVSSSSTSSGFGGFFGGTGTRPSSRPSWVPSSGNFGGTGDKTRRQTAASSCPSGYVLSGQSTSSGATFGESSRAGPNTRMMLMAHGIMASLAFVILFPFGAISIRLLSFPGLLWFHAGLQIFAYVVYIISFGLGVWLATRMREIDNYHPVIGIILLILVFFMPFLGWLHHVNFKKFQQRTLPSHVHVWLGRVVITLGIINGGLGLKLADNTTSGKIAYGVIAAVVWLVYVAAIVIGERRRPKTLSGTPPKYDDVTMDSPPGRSPIVSTDRTREFYGGRK